jgi:hypothetical protein
MYGLEVTAVGNDIAFAIELQKHGLLKVSCLFSSILSSSLLLEL